MKDSKTTVSEKDFYHFYDAGEFTTSILTYMDTDGYKRAVGEIGSDYEKGFKAGLCLAPCVIMAYATGFYRAPKENFVTVPWIDKKGEES